MSLSISTSSRNLWATISRASSGHAWNQSMVQQLIREGNILRRFLNASPIGLMAVENNNSQLRKNFVKLQSTKGHINLPTEHNVKVGLHTVNEEVVH